MRTIAAVLIFCSLAACQRAPSTEAAPKPSPPTPTPTLPANSDTGQMEGASISPSAAGAVEPREDVEAPEEVNLDSATAENRLVKTEVLARIDVMPTLSPEEKDKLYVQVERARGMGRIVTIPFAAGKVTVGAAELTALEEKIHLPQIKKFTEDPTVVFVVLGFADKKGDEQKNLTISLQRADSIAKSLKERCAIMNVIHAVGMGSSDIFDTEDLAKNRVVEVWAVLP
jgi:outer membrane protein OmpA-like peptidoglycan-associated protein